MLKANVNTIYTAELVRKGISSKGHYEMVLLKAAGNDLARIPIWVENIPCGIEQGMKFRIAEITGAAIRHIKPSDRFDKWQDEFSLTAVVVPV